MPVHAIVVAMNSPRKMLPGEARFVWTEGFFNRVGDMAPVLAALGKGKPNWRGFAFH